MSDRALNDVMEFDHVIEVHADGTVTDAPDRRELWAPDLLDNELAQFPGVGWSLMDGYSGQDHYAGPIMHNSEYIGGRMADDIRSTPGYYVALVCHHSTNADGEPFGENDDDIEGWAVAFRPAMPATVFRREAGTATQSLHD